MDGDKRADLTMKVLEILRKRKEELAQREAKYVGKPIIEARDTDLTYTFRA